MIHIWEEASKGAHPFLEFNYTNMVKEQLINIYIPNVDTWIYTHNNEVLGFISMLNNVLAVYLYAQNTIEKVLELN